MSHRVSSQFNGKLSCCWCGEAPTIGHECWGSGVHRADQAVGRPPNDCELRWRCNEAGVGLATLVRFSEVTSADEPHPFLPKVAREYVGCHGKMSTMLIRSSPTGGRRLKAQTDDATLAASILRGHDVCSIRHWLPFALCYRSPRSERWHNVSSSLSRWRTPDAAQY